MCAREAILGRKLRSCIRSTPNSKWFIFTSPLGLEEDTKRDWVAGAKWERQMKYWPSGSCQTSLMPEPEALVVPIQVGVNG